MAKKKTRGLFTFLIVALIAGTLYYAYQKYFLGKIKLKDKNYTYIFIEPTDSFEDVLEDINAENIIDDPVAFAWLAKEMGLREQIHPGKYRITNGMNMRQIINLIKYKKEEKVKLSFNSQIRNMDEFVSYTDEKLALSSSDLEDFITDEVKLKKYFDLSPENSMAMLIPSIYEVSWAITSEDFFNKLEETYKSFWNANRSNQAKKMGFTIPQISTLASIVQSESSIESEQEKIAGVYINRLRLNMPLQADPTLKFANKNYEAQRVLDEDKTIDSPYNTYLYKGLPPGPICLVGAQAVDATLNYMHHKFIFFCAKPQLNGFSNFSITYEQHRKFATAYQNTLNKKGINR